MLIWTFEDIVGVFIEFSGYLMKNAQDYFIDEHFFNIMVVLFKNFGYYH